jgi:uncharacterized protein (TIGR02265 family)
MAEFASPDWDAPLDVEEYVRATPKGAVIKGMFLGRMVQACREQGYTLTTAGDRYVPFKEYPMAEHMRVLVEASTLLFPNRSLRSSLRSMGRTAHEAFSKSIVGGVIVGSVHETDVLARLDVLIRGYALMMPTSHVELVESRDKHALVRMHSVYSFWDTHHVGVVEGFLHASGAMVDVRVRTHSIAAGDMLIAW